MPIIPVRPKFVSQGVALPATGGVTSVATTTNGRELAVVANTDRYNLINLHVEGTIVTPNTLAGDKKVYVYAYRVVKSSAGANLYPGNITGNAADLAAIKVGALIFLGAIDVLANNDATIKGHFVLHKPGPAWGVALVSNCGAGPGPVIDFTVTYNGEYIEAG